MYSPLYLTSEVIDEQTDNFGSNCIPNRGKWEHKMSGIKRIKEING